MAPITTANQRVQVLIIKVAATATGLKTFNMIRIPVILVSVVPIPPGNMLKAPTIVAKE